MKNQAVKNQAVKNQVIFRTQKKISLPNNDNQTKLIGENSEVEGFQPTTESVRAQIKLSVEEFNKSVEAHLQVKKLYQESQKTNENTTYSDLLKLIEHRSPIIKLVKNKFGEEILTTVSEDNGIYLQGEKISSDMYWALLEKASKESTTHKVDEIKPQEKVNSDIGLTGYDNMEGRNPSDENSDGDLYDFTDFENNTSQNLNVTVFENGNLIDFNETVH